jgi:hypothetical protein
MGSTVPRIQTPSRSATTAGPKAAALMALAGVELLPWQRLVLDRGLELGTDGQYVHSEVAAIVARGNGKSVMLAARILWALLNGEDTLAVAGNTRSVARELWSYVVGLIENTPQLRERMVGGVRRSNGQEEIQLRSVTGHATRYRIGAAAAGVRGFRAKLLIVDEVRELQNPDAYAAMTGVQAGIPERTQRWLVSTAGDLRSIVLNDLRDRGRLAAQFPTQAPRLAWLEWSAKENAHLDDRDAWAAANPALGYRVSLDHLESELAAVPETAYRTEYLNQWVDVISAVVAPGDWDACTEAVPLERSWRSWLGVELSPSRSHAAAVLCALDPDGIKHIRLLDLVTQDGDQPIDIKAFSAQVLRRWRDFNPVAIIGDRYTASPILEDLAQARVKIQPLTAGALSLATSAWIAGIRGRVIRHDGNENLTGHVLAAGVKPSGDGGVVISRARSVGPIAACVAGMLAVSAADAPAAPSPVIVSARRR